MKIQQPECCFQVFLLSRWHCLVLVHRPRSCGRSLSDLLQHGRMVLHTFPCALLSRKISGEWSTGPILMLIPWDNDGKNIRNLDKKFDVIKDWSSVDAYKVCFQAPTLKDVLINIALSLDEVYKEYFTDEA